MAEGKPISHEFVSKEKDIATEVWMPERRKRRNLLPLCVGILHFVGIGCLVVVVGDQCERAIGVKNMKAKKAAAEIRTRRCPHRNMKPIRYAEINDVDGKLLCILCIRKYR